MTLNGAILFIPNIDKDKCICISHFRLKMKAGVASQSVNYPNEALVTDDGPLMRRLINYAVPGDQRAVNRSKGDTLEVKFLEFVGVRSLGVQRGRVHDLVGIATAAL